MCNKEIRDFAKSKGVYLWELAYHLGYSDNYFSRLLRKEFDDNFKARCITAINDLAKNKTA